MSVIFTPRARASRWKALWPLALLLAVSIIGGVCLGCTFESKIDGKRYKVCTDGPVFDGREVF